MQYSHLLLHQTCSGATGLPADMDLEVPQPTAASGAEELGGASAEQAGASAEVRDAMAPGNQEAEVPREAAPGSASGTFFTCNSKALAVNGWLS